MFHVEHFFISGHVFHVKHRRAALAFPGWHTFPPFRLNTHPRE